MSFQPFPPCRQPHVSALPTAKVLVLGLGDLGARIASGLARIGTAAEIVVASRQLARGAAFARLTSACGPTPVRFTATDGLDFGALRALIRAERPDLIVQCASLLSPWVLFARTDPQAFALRTAGFALQLCAQLPVVHNLMNALAEEDNQCPVVNCSYPDLTNAVLATQGLAPLIGIGNAGMIRALAPAAHDAAGPLRLFAHHSQVGAVVCADRARLGDTPPPRLFRGNTEYPADPLFSGIALPQDQELNALSASHAVDIAAALLPDGTPLRTAAPGPLGLPGGWPVLITPSSVALDLPASATAADFLPFQHQSARGDGIAGMAADGTVHFTDALRARLPSQWRMLAEPLRPEEALARHTQLLAALKVMA